MTRVCLLLLCFGILCARVRTRRRGEAVLLLWRVCRGVRLPCQLTAHIALSVLLRVKQERKTGALRDPRNMVGDRGACVTKSVRVWRVRRPPLFPRATNHLFRDHVGGVCDMWLYTGNQGVGRYKRE